MARVIEKPNGEPALSTGLPEASPKLELVEKDEPEEAAEEVEGRREFYLGPNVQGPSGKGRWP